LYTDNWLENASDSDLLGVALPLQPAKSRPIKFTPINSKSTWDESTLADPETDDRVILPKQDGRPSETGRGQDQSLSRLHGTGETPLLAVSAVLPDRLRSLFAFRYFNSMQSKTFSPIYNSDTSIIISAPTGSGKTVCFDLAIARLVATESSSQAFKVKDPQSLPTMAHISGHLHWTD